MIKSEYVQTFEDFEHTWIKYTSDKIKGLTLGYEYEFHTNLGLKAIQPHKLPNGFIIAKEGIHHRIQGLELKSPIAPLFYHKLLLKRFPKLPWNMKPSGRENAGGIHVHVGVTGSGGLPVRHKIMTMFRANKEILKKISGRSQEMFNQYSKFDYNYAAPTYQQMSWSPSYYSPYDHIPEDEAYHDSHYNILNTQRSSTFEFRLFAAHPKLLLPALEMADSLFVCAKQTRGAMEWDEWLAFIKRWPRYSNIYQRVKECQS